MSELYDASFNLGATAGADNQYTGYFTDSTSQKSFWDKIISAGAGIIGGVFGGNQYPVYSAPAQSQSGLSLTTIALILGGVYLLTRKR
jgi:hypothetical protein